MGAEISRELKKLINSSFVNWVFVAGLGVEVANENESQNPPKRTIKKKRNFIKYFCMSILAWWKAKKILDHKFLDKKMKVWFLIF